MEMGDVKTVIAEDVEITGSIKCASNIQVDGKLNGDVTCNGNVIVGQTAVVKGNVNANSTTIMGQINGNITVKDMIEMKSTTRLTGDIRAKRLTVEDGVTFIGKAEVNPSGTAGQRATEGKPAEEESGDEAEVENRKSGMFGGKR
jgi:cytoskeletal protein CcmA (bactofilin family)